MNNQLTINPNRKYNSIRHGVLTKIILPDEATSAKKIEETFVEEYTPQTLIERLLVTDMAIAYVRKQRAIKAEREYFMEILNPPLYKETVIREPLLANPPIGDTISGERTIELVKAGYKASVNSDVIESIDKTYARYITTCERQFFRALHELQRVQAVRLGLKQTSVAVDFIGEREQDE